MSRTAWRHREAAVKRDLAHWIALPFDLAGRLISLVLGLLIIVFVFGPVCLVLFFMTITSTAVKTAWFSFIGQPHSEFDRMTEVTVILPKAVIALLRTVFGRAERAPSLAMPPLQVLQQFLMSLFFFSWLVYMWQLSESALVPTTFDLYVWGKPLVQDAFSALRDFVAHYLAYLWRRVFA
jgi:hypothetical protein